MIQLMATLAMLLAVVPTSLVASEAPPDVHQFNVICPAPKLLPVLDRAYHECSNGFANGSCEKFVETFRQLLPEYDCQRSFDATPTKKYVVPAIWLAGDAALEDYIRLLWRMSSSKEKRFRHKLIEKACAEAKKLFGSVEFRKILDGHLAEDYWRLSEQTEKKLKR